MVLSTHSLNPYTLYLCSLNDDTGDALHSFSIVSSSVNKRIESYWSKFVDRPGWWKSFFHGRFRNTLIHVNSLYWIVPGSDL